METLRHRRRADCADCAAGFYGGRGCWGGAGAEKCPLHHRLGWREAVRLSEVNPGQRRNQMMNLI